MKKADILPAPSAFTLLELLVVIAIIAILAGLMFPALSRAKAAGKRTVCLDNLNQIAKGVHLYTDDFNEILFPIRNVSSSLAVYEWTAYDPLTRGYVGLKGAPSPKDKLFACPADTFCYWALKGQNADLVSHGLHLQSDAGYSSYAFNAGNAVIRIPAPAFPGMYPGIMGSRLSSIKIPTKTALVVEFPALDGYTWHGPLLPGDHYFNNAPNLLSFADGHVSYIKMYRGTNNPSRSIKSPFAFDPPAGYDYQWSGD